jgi:hypothetical protein
VVFGSQDVAACVDLDGAMRRRVRTSFLIVWLVRPSIQWDIAKAVNTTARCGRRWIRVCGDRSAGLAGRVWTFGMRARCATAGGSADHPGRVGVEVGDVGLPPASARAFASRPRLVVRVPPLIVTNGSVSAGPARRQPSPPSRLAGRCRAGIAGLGRTCTGRRSCGSTCSAFGPMITGWASTVPSTGSAPQGSADATGRSRRGRRAVARRRSAAPRPSSTPRPQVGVGRTEVLDISRPVTVLPHHLDSDRPRGGPHRPHIRHGPTLPSPPLVRNSRPSLQRNT